MLALLEPTSNLSLCLVGERLGEMGHCEVLEGDDDLILLGDLDPLELSG